MNQEEVSASFLQLACSLDVRAVIAVSTADVPVFGCLLHAPRVASVETRVQKYKKHFTGRRRGVTCCVESTL